MSPRKRLQIVLTTHLTTLQDETEVQTMVSGLQVVSPKSNNIFSLCLILQISPVPSIVMITDKLKEKG